MMTGNQQPPLDKSFKKHKAYDVVQTEVGGNPITKKNAIEKEVRDA